jgi:hypothetical protein
VTMARSGVEHLAEKVATEVDGVLEAPRPRSRRR